MAGKDTDKKILHLEVLRILGILCVMFIHSGSRGHEVFAYTESTRTFILSIIMSSVSNVGVNLFWMVSGALLLTKTETAETTYRHRIPRVFIALFIFSVIRYFYNYATGSTKEIGLIDFIQRFLSGNIYVPYWFIYFYIGVLLALPFLRRAVQGMNTVEWKYFAAIQIVFLLVVKSFELIPDFEFVLPFYIPDSVNMFVLGYFAEWIISRWYQNKRVAIIISGSLIVLMVMIEFYLTVRLGKPEGNYPKVYMALLAQPLAFAIFIFIKEAGACIGKCPVVLRRLLILAGSCSFGIYLIEDYIRNALVDIFEILAPVITTLPACVVWLLCCYFLGVIIVLIMKKIPYLKKLL